MLTPSQLTFERCQCTLGQVATEVGDHTNGMWDLCKRLKSGSALKVHQDKVDQVWMMSDSQTYDQRLQQLTFARAGGTSNDAMRAMSCVVEVKPPRPINAHADGNTQTSK